MRALLLVVLVFAPLSAQYTISTFAGGGPADGTPALSAAIDAGSLGQDAEGNLYLECCLGKIFKMDRSGVLHLVAGKGEIGYSGDGGPAVDALVDGGFAVDSTGTVYIADFDHNRIRKVANGIITTIAGNGTAGYSGDGGPAVNATLNGPIALALDGGGNIYIVDQQNCRIRKISNGIITTVAGNGGFTSSGDGGPAIDASIGQPFDIAIDGGGNLYIAQPSNNRVRRISNGIITVVAGNGNPIYANTPAGQIGDGGPATNALVNAPAKIAVDRFGDLYISDYWGSRVREVQDGVINTVAGTGTAGFSGDGGPATSAQLSSPQDLLVDAAGSLYIADSGRIRKVTNGIITTVVGNGMYYSGDGVAATSAELHYPWGVTLDNVGNVYFADQAGLIRKVANGVIRTVAGNVQNYGYSGDGGSAVDAGLNGALGVAVDASGNIYIADQRNNRVRKVSNGIITTVAGTGAFGFSGDGGPATSASLSLPRDVAVDAGGNLYISDAGNNRIRRVSNGVISTIAGNGSVGYSGDGGPAVNASIGSPWGLAVDSAGNLFFVDQGNFRVREIRDGMIFTVAGNGTNSYGGDGGNALDASLGLPTSIAVDRSGSLYITEIASNRVRKVANGIITTIAGGGDQPLGDGGPATSVQLHFPAGIAVNDRGDVYFADLNLNRIRLLTPTPTPVLSTLSPNLAVAGSGSFTLALGGSGFVSGVVVRWNGTPLSTTYVSSSQITAQVPANLLTAAGTATITAVNAGTPASNSLAFPVISATATLGLTPTALQFGANSAHTSLTGPQTVVVQVPPGVSWFASTSGGFLSVSPASGTGAGSFTVSLLPSSLPASGSATGQITVTATGLANSPQTVNVTVNIAAASQITGSFDTPLNNTTGLGGSIAVTGWALDSIEVAKVDIWREPLASEHTTGLVYIGDAVFVEGARPDVEAAHGSLPRASRAGWGYLMLTNFLPNSVGSGGYGNGTYKIHAIAHNAAGKSLDLGTKTITVNNTNAVKPFGAIDTPGQGETVSGANYVNYGWALTKQPNYIPTDGSTLEVYVDGQPQGHPVYNNYRSDIATLFPGYANSSAAVGYFTLNTTSLANGVHTISWSVTDSAGNADGIGSRYFTVLNTGGNGSPAPLAARPGRRTLKLPRNRTMEAQELSRIELPMDADAGYLVVNGERRPLPIGSSLKDGVFYWQLGPGFFGTYDLEFHRAGSTPARIRISVRPME